MPTRTPAQLAAIRAFNDLVQTEGKDEAHEFLTEIGDMFSLWPQPEPLAADDISKLAARLLRDGMVAVRCNQRGAFLRAMADHVADGRRIVEAA